MHKAAKQIVADAPALNLRLGDSGFRWQINFDEAHVERSMNGFIPDVLVREQSGPPLAVEIHVTHAVDLTKEDKIRRARLTCVEIDLSRVARKISYADLQRRICEGEFPARLVHNENEELQRSLDAAEAFRHPRRFRRRQEEVARQEAQDRELQQKQEAWRQKAPWLRP